MVDLESKTNHRLRLRRLAPLVPEGHEQPGIVEPVPVDPTPLVREPALVVGHEYRDVSWTIRVSPLRAEHEQASPRRDDEPGFALFPASEQVDSHRFVTVGHKRPGSLFEPPSVELSFPLNESPSDSDGYATYPDGLDIHFSP